MDRKRLEWDRSDKAETASKLKQAQDDFLKGLSHFNPEDPGFDQDFDMWKSWYQKRNPDYAQMIDDTFQGMDSESIRFAARQAKKQMVRKTEKLNPGDTLVDSSTGETVAQGSQKPEKKSQMAIWLEEQAKYPKGSRQYQFYQNKINKDTTWASDNKPDEQDELELNEAEERLAKSIADGTIDPQTLSKRGKKYNFIISRAKQINPDLDMPMARADNSLLKNQTYRQKEMMAESLGTILDSVTEAGKNLDFSSNKIVGKSQAWTKDMMNDPDYRYYMSLRNDAVQTLTAVMRGVGMSDKSVELELESMPKAMSPEAFEAWYKGQMEALEPRLEMYRSVRNRKKNRTADTRQAPAPAPAVHGDTFNPQTGEWE